MPPVADRRSCEPHITDVPPEALLRLASDTYDQYEALRIRLANQYQALTSEYTEGEKGGSYGKQVHETHPAADALKAHLEAVAKLEHQAGLELNRAWRKHPLAPWAKNQIGLGERQMARLLAAIGDPAERPNLYKLWAYCGYSVVNGESQRRRKGQQSNWNETARMRGYLIAVSCLKQAASPYRKVYDLRRQRTAETHPDWTAGHSHADGLRVAAKQVLKDLYFESRRANTASHPCVATPAGTDHDKDNQ